MDRQRGQLAELLATGRVLALTGAGISTDSGIPDYRGPDGRLHHSQPMTYQRFTGSEEDRQRYWARSHIGWRRIAEAAPNSAHRALADLEDAGLLTGVVTQNVDGLHTAACNREVVDLHGRLDGVVCLECDDRRHRLEMALRLDVLNPGFREQLTDDTEVVRPDGDVIIPEHRLADFRVPECRRCGGVLKPDVVFFGEHVPRERFGRALGLLSDSAALLVLGSSLHVGSGYRFVTAARRAGIPVAIVNRGATRGDRHADLKIDADLAEAFVPPARRVSSTPMTVGEVP
jgi:NAD-dependent SIR2 family protein deacetylase